MGSSSFAPIVAGLLILCPKWFCDPPDLGLCSLACIVVALVCDFFFFGFGFVLC